MKKLYYVVLDAYDLIMTVDEEKNLRYMTANEEFPTLDMHITENEEEYVRVATEFLLNDVTDDSSWETDVDYEEMFAWIDKVDGRLIAKIEKDL